MIQALVFQMKMNRAIQFYLYLGWGGETRRTDLLQNKADILEWRNMVFSLYSYLRIMKTPVYPKV